MAFNADEHEEVPFVEIDFDTPLRVNDPFHFIRWPQTPILIESEKLFCIDQLNPRSSNYAETKAKVLELMGVDPKGRWQPSLSDWRTKP